MVDDGTVRAESCVGRAVVGGGQEVGRVVGRARAFGEGERKWGKEGGVVAAATILNRCAEVGDSQRGGATRRPEIGGRGRRGAVVSRGRPNRGGEKGLTDGLQPQCRAAALADRRARAAH
jgi:hypothetical protein